MDRSYYSTYEIQATNEGGLAPLLNELKLTNATGPTFREVSIFDRGSSERKLIAPIEILMISAECLFLTVHPSAA